MLLVVLLPSLFLRSMDSLTCKLQLTIYRIDVCWKAIFITLLGWKLQLKGISEGEEYHCIHTEWLACSSAILSFSQEATTDQIFSCQHS